MVLTVDTSFDEVLTTLSPTYFYEYLRELERALQWLQEIQPSGAIQFCGFGYFKDGEYAHLGVPWEPHRPMCVFLDHTDELEFHCIEGNYFHRRNLVGRVGLRLSIIGGYRWSDSSLSFGMFLDTLAEIISDRDEWLYLNSRDSLWQEVAKAHQSNEKNRLSKLMKVACKKYSADGYEILERTISCWDARAL